MMQPQQQQQKTSLRCLVDRLQRIRVHQKHSSDGEKTEGIPFISGLDDVCFGTKGAADAIRLYGIQPPRYAWFVLSGIFCDIIQLGLDMFLHFGLQIHDASTCWFGGFVLSIIVRHTSHRYLVFGAHVGGYWTSLGRLYVGYSFSIALSTLFDMIMTRSSLQMGHYVAWIFTLLWTGAFNYFMLKRCWKVGVQETAPGRKDDNEREILPVSVIMSPSSESLA